MSHNFYLKSIVGKSMADPFSLDPFSTIARLALLPFMEQGVKIGICDNKIEFFDLSITAWVRRNYMDFFRRGCSKHDIFHLRVPVARAIQWYRDAAPGILALAADGLEKLAANYTQHGNVTVTVQSMVRLLRGQEEAPAEDASNKPLLLELRAEWSPEEIETMSGLFSLLRSKQSPHTVSCIITFLSGKEPNLLTIIRRPTM